MATAQQHLAGDSESLARQQAKDCCFRVFPAPHADGRGRVFVPGDPVFVKLKTNQHEGRATVIERDNEQPQALVDSADPATSAEAGVDPPVTDNAAPGTVTKLRPDFKDRVRVRFECDGSTFHVRPARLTRMFHAKGSCPQIVITDSTDMFRKLARTQARRGDFAVDIGCSYGLSCEVLRKQVGPSGRVLGIDVSKQLVAKAAASYPDVEFAMFDAIEDQLRLQQMCAGCDLVLMDIGGNRELDVVVRAMSAVIRTLAPPTLVVKSINLKRHADAGASPDPDEGTLRAQHAWWTDLTRCAFHTAVRTRKHTNTDTAAGKSGRRFPMHPLKHPPRTTAEGVFICRYHNYDECKRQACEYDHEHCNYCGKRGHQARWCVEE
eukprot:m.224712 g.224712  ORF g.224712 m.224712 type:complete len:379 (-) comp18773_c0_seq3:138-1274(-)